LDSQIHGAPAPTHSAATAMEQRQPHIKLLAHLRAKLSAINVQSLQPACSAIQ